jgi:hypothetical protein
LGGDKVSEELPEVKLIEFCETVGKSITAAIVYDDYGCLKFRDGTALVISRESEEYRDTSQFSCLERYDQLSDSDKCGLGFITKEEYDELQREYLASVNARELARAEARDKAEYARLKAKFEGTP